MQPALVIRAFIASPTDVQAERDVAVQEVTNWNAAHSHDRDAIIEAVRIETHALAALGNHPQEVVNAQLLDRCDFLVAIFWSKIGSPTNKEKSGTIHEIRAFINQKGAENVMLFFSKQHLPHDIDSAQLDALRGFTKEMQTEGLYVGYEGVQDFKGKFGHQLSMRMNDVLRSGVATSAWSKKARMNEEDRLAVQEKQRFLDSQHESRQLRAASSRATMSKLLGHEITLQPTHHPNSELSQPRLKDELMQLHMFLARRLTQHENENDIGRAKILAGQFRSKVNDVLVQLGYQASEGMKLELHGWVAKLNEIEVASVGMGGRYGTSGDFWRALNNLVSEMQDLAEMV